MNWNTLLIVAYLQDIMVHFLVAVDRAARHRTSLQPWIYANTREERAIHHVSKHRLDVLYAVHIFFNSGYVPSNENGDAKPVPAIPAIFPMSYSGELS